MNCPHLVGTECQLASQLVARHAGATVAIQANPKACAACWPNTGTIDRPGPVVASLCCHTGKPESSKTMLAAVTRHLAPVPAKLVQLSVPRQTRATAETLPCTHRGAVTRQQESDLCGSRGEFFDVHSCDLHGECAIGRVCQRQTVRACSGCEDRLEPVATRIELGPNPARVLSGEGRGIVIPGGGIYLRSAWVTIRMVRHFGCDLPIELCLLPWETVTNNERSAIEAYDVTVRTLDAGYCLDERVESKRWRKPIYLGGWQGKVQSVLQSSFHEVVFLDADCYPVESGWLERLTETGQATFCGDVTASDGLLTQAACDAFGVTRGTPVDSGAFYVTKADPRWCDIVGAINGPGHVREVYGETLFGDKDSWWIAHELAGVPYRILDRGRMMTGSYIRHDCGLLHRTGCKFTDGRPINTPQHGQHVIEGDTLTARFLRGWPPLAVRCQQDAEVCRAVIEHDEYKLDAIDEPMTFIVDAGGHIGTFSAIAKRHWPECQLLIVEPAADNVEMIRRNVTEPFALFEAALGEQPGATSLVTEPGHSVYRTTDGADVLVLRLSDLLDHLGWPRVDLLKIDIEGGERGVFADLAATGWLARVGRIVGEWHGTDVCHAVVEMLRATHSVTVTATAHDCGPFAAVPH